jgi:glycosyltransferase involved in cell wall biosynthesis
MTTVLYITENGITDHIGQSQIAPYLLGLAGLNYRIHVLSAEKVERAFLLKEYKTLFENAGLHWTHIPYRRKPRLFSHALTQLRTYWHAKKIIKIENVCIVHCRGFLSTIIGYRLKKRFGVRLIFDFRDFSADGGMLKTRGLEKLVYRAMKKLEGTLLRESDKVVCLTDKARHLLSSWYFSHEPDVSQLFEVIPCCADFNHFSHEKISEEAVNLIRLELGILKGETVLLYLGSLGPDYLLDEMFKLFRQLLVVQPNSKFLFIINNGKHLIEKIRRLHKIEASRILCVTANRDEIPALIGLADLSVIFIRADVSKAGCSPTKLAELFALNVPIIANSGVGDLDAIMNLECNGSTVVEDFSDITLLKAVEMVLDVKRSNPVSIREHSREFDLQSGVEKYAKVYSELSSIVKC